MTHIDLRFLSDRIIEILKAENETRDFRRSLPIPHIVVDIGELLINSTQILQSSSTDFDLGRWNQPLDAHQHNKYSNDSPLSFPQQIQSLANVFMWGPFLEELEAVTGIQGLIPDPYFTGGGLHLSLGGGLLDLHTDFHLYKRLNLYRRLNLLLYLNPDWKPGDGGELELFKKSNFRNNESVQIEPTFGKLVVFETNDDSLHGFRNPVASGKKRLSLALYFYTSIGTSHFSGDASTYWLYSKGQGPHKKLLFAVSNFLMGISRAFSLLAHLTNPLQGFKWFKTRQKNKARASN